MLEWSQVGFYSLLILKKPWRWFSLFVHYSGIYVGPVNSVKILFKDKQNFVLIYTGRYLALTIDL